MKSQVEELRVFMHLMVNTITLKNYLTTHFLQSIYVCIYKPYNYKQMSLLRETAYYEDNIIKASTYHKGEEKLSVVFKDGHIEEYSSINKKDYDFFKKHNSQSEALISFGICIDEFYSSPLFS